MTYFSFGDAVKYFVNLLHRIDRLEHMENEFKKVGFVAERIPGALPETFDLDDPKLQVMKNRTPGAIGCHFSQVKAMRFALLQDKHVLVMEDDLVFCSDFMKRMDLIEKFLNTHEWDVFWLGGTYHREPPYWHGEGHPNMPECDCTLGRDYELTDDPRIVRTYGAFSTFAYIVNVNSIEKILRMLDERLHESAGIDTLFIMLQPYLKTYAFVPGCVKQIDNMSDIGKGMTIFSGFHALGKHWWADRM